MNDFGLPERARQLIRKFFSAHPEITTVKVYGSRAMGTHRPSSDIDLAIYTTVERDISPHIKEELEQLPLPYQFDVTDYDHIDHQALKEHIDSVGLLFE